jgi:hypothetical protein
MVHDTAMAAAPAYITINNAAVAFNTVHDNAPLCLCVVVAAVVVAVAA